LPEPARRKRFVLLYAVLAGATLATIGASLLVGASVNAAFRASSERSAQWARLQPDLTQLSRLASELGAPGLAAFGSGDVPAQRERLAASQAAFEKAIAAIRKDLPDDPSRVALEEGLERASIRARRLNAETEHLLLPLEQGQPLAATAALASHDREHAGLLEDIRLVRDEVSRHEAAIYQDAQRAVGRFARLELLLAVIAAVLGAAAALFGWTALRDSEQAAHLRQRDLDELRQSQERLREGDERYRSVVASLQEGVCVHDASGAVTAWNASALQLLGIEEAELAGSRPSDPCWRSVREDESLLPAEHFPTSLALQTARPVKSATLGLERDGQPTLWLSINAMPLVREGADRPYGAVTSFADVSERRAAERAVRESEERLNAFLEALPVGVFIVDHEGQPIFTNLAARDILGMAVIAPGGHGDLSEAYQVYRSGTDALYPSPELPVLRALKGEACSAQDVEIRRPEGTVELDVIAAPIRDGSGRIQYALAAFEDVTEKRRRERLQAALHAASAALASGYEREAALPRLLEALGRELRWPFGAYWSVDPEARVLRLTAVWNGVGPAAEELVEARRGWTCEPGSGAPGMAWQTAAPTWVPDVQSDPGFPMAPLARKAGLQGAFAAPVQVGGEVLGVLEFLARELPQPDPMLLEAFLAVGSQVAQLLERDAADGALRASEERMRAVLENMLEGLIVSDPSGTILSLNSAAEQMLGFKSWELVGENLAMLLPRSVQDPARFLSDAMQRALGRVTEWDLRRKNGEMFRCELTLYEFQTPTGRNYAGHVRDISEKRKLERMKKEFVATVSHELRTPLTSIRGSLSLLSAGAMGPLDPEALEVVQIAERNAIRLIALINDILDLERLESGRLDLEIKPHDVADVVTRAIDSVAGMAQTRGVRIATGPAPGRFMGDPERLVQVLVNLLSNAVKFSPDGAVVNVDCAALDHSVEVRVKDQGRGIPASYRDLIFNRFQQVEASDSRQKGGSGLGLAICKSIVEQHGGTIGFESEHGHGSTFWFRIPQPAEAG
jgi:PAS domain S-box-containing protein